MRLLTKLKLTKKLMIIPVETNTTKPTQTAGTSIWMDEENKDWLERYNIGKKKWKKGKTADLEKLER